MKKIKLLLSLAMMCLSLAVLCFGVFSAMSVSYTISGTISYEVTDVMVEIQTKVYMSTEKVKKTLSELTSAAQTDFENMTFTQIGQNTNYKIAKDDIETFNTLNSGTTATFTASGIEIDYNESYQYYIVINIKSYTSDKSVFAQITDETVVSGANSIKYTNNYQNGIVKPEGKDFNDASNIGKNIVIAYGLDDEKTSINGTVNFSYSLKIAYGNAEGTIANFSVLNNSDLSINTETTTQITNNQLSYTFTPQSSEAVPNLFNGKSFWIYNFKITDIPSNVSSVLVNANSQKYFGLGILFNNNFKVAQTDLENQINAIQNYSLDNSYMYAENEGSIVLEKNGDNCAELSLVYTSSDNCATADSVTLGISLDFEKTVDFIDVGTTYDVKNSSVSISTKEVDVSSGFKQSSALRQMSKNYEQSGISGGTELYSMTTTTTKTQTNTAQSLQFDFNENTNSRIKYLATQVTNNGTSPVYVKMWEDKEVDMIEMNACIYRSQDIESLAAGETATMLIGYSLLNQSPLNTWGSLNYTIEVGQSTSYNPLKTQNSETYNISGTDFTKEAYKYMELGDFYGVPVRWKLVATSTTQTSGDGVYNGYKSYDVSQTATGTGVFLQQTQTGTIYYGNVANDYQPFLIKYYTEREDTQGLTDCSFNSYTSENSNYYRTDDSGTKQTELANNYFNSRIEQYLNNTTNDVYKYVNTQTTPDTSKDKSTFVKDLNISTASDSTYSNIISRQIGEIQTGYMSSYKWTTSGGTTYTSTNSDKFWLMSVEEMLTWVAGKTTNTAWNSDLYSKMVYGVYNNSNYLGTYFWLRSGSASSFYFTYRVYNDGNYYDYNYVDSSFLAARAAFNFALKD